MNRRALFAALLALTILAPLTASAQMRSQRLYMRNTVASTAGTAGAVPLINNWGLGSPGAAYSGYTDSITFSHATGSAATNRDTTAAYHIVDWRFPPTYRARSGGQMARAQKSYGNAGPTTVSGFATDSVTVDTTDTTPWIIVRVHQDSTAYQSGGTPTFSGGSLLDSVYIHAQWSQDGVVWYGVNGTPTRNGGFLNSTSPFGTATEGGIVHQSLAGLEINQAFDEVDFKLECQPSLVVQPTSLIINRTLCALPDRYFLRFIVSVCDDGYGQFAIDVDYWDAADRN